MPGAMLLGIKNEQDRHGLCLLGAYGIETLTLHLMGPLHRKVEGESSRENHSDYMISKELPALKLLRHFHIKLILLSRFYKFAILQLSAGRDLSYGFLQVN